MQTLTLGFSPCPNDTFIFDAMVYGKIDTGGLSFDCVMEDVETLNRYAAEGRLDITKLSYNAFLYQTQRYALLHSGSALGSGVGPLVIARGPLTPDRLSSCRIAIPGAQTTANLLLTLAFPGARNKTELVFSEIEQAVLSGDVDAGVIIHENRFTYAQKGLVKIIDLGSWWEETMQAAIPLGGIVMRRDHDPELIARVDALIRESVTYAWKHYPELPPFVRAHAQEMDEQVMRQHIGLYVNDYTTDLGAAGIHAVTTMFARAADAGLLHGTGGMPRQLFY